jgi:LysM repeat protein
MSKRSSAPARVLAVIALVCGIVVLFVVITTSLGGDDGTSGKPAANGKVKRSEQRGEDGKIRGAYVVQNGDTLSSIAHETGVPVAQILELNPGVDPQILISGEKLKLR